MAKYNCYYVGKSDKDLKLLIERIDTSVDGITSSYYELIIERKSHSNKNVNSVEIKAIKNPVDYIYRNFSSKSLKESKLGDEMCKEVVEMVRIRFQLHKDSMKKYTKRITPFNNTKIVKSYPRDARVFMNEEDPTLVEDDRYNSSKAFLKSLRSSEIQKRIK